jgi:hypothetical protein
MLTACAHTGAGRIDGAERVVKMAANDSWMYQGRDERGRFGNGTSPNSDDGDPDSSGGAGMLPQMQAVVYGAVGHLSPAERTKFTAYLDRAAVARLSECLLAWSEARGLGRNSFRERFLGGAGSDEVVDHLRKAADTAARATTPEEQRAAAGELAAAWRSVGGDRWPRFIAGAHDRAAAVSIVAASGQASSAVVTKVQELLLTPRIPFLAEPPKGIIPRLMERIPRQSDKEAATDVPSWARGIARRVGETPNDYARRLMDGRYGPGNWKPSNREYNQIKKFGERAFRDPTTVAPAEGEGQPEASTAPRSGANKEPT